MNTPTDDEIDAAILAALAPTGEELVSWATIAPRIPGGFWPKARPCCGSTRMARSISPGPRAVPTSASATTLTGCSRRPPRRGAGCGAYGSHEH